MPGMKSGSSHSSSSSSSSSRSSFSSSSSSSSSYGGGFSSFSTPSSRTNTSHSSYPSSSFNSSPRKTTRTTRNNPLSIFPNLNDYYSTSTEKPRRYVSSRHTYIFFPSSWTDSSGKYWKRGYYDEDKRYYKNLENTKNTEKNSGLLLNCPYCNTSKLVNWNKTSDSLDLTCSNCSGQMEIISSLDDILSEEELTEEELSKASLSDYIDEEENFDYTTTGNAGKTVRRFFIMIFLFPILFSLLRNCSITITNLDNQPTSSIVTENIHYNLGREFYLEKSSGNAYTLKDTSINNGKHFLYSSEEDAYYCIDDDYWIAYNSNVSPAVFQYWYEPISGSSEFNGYGWMEYDVEEQRWYIEYDYAKWMPLSEAKGVYDTSQLYYIK